jgi:hypothetical protein
LSPFRLFVEAYHHRGHVLLLDDVLEGSLAREQGPLRNLLLTLCSTNKPARMRWSTQSRELLTGGVPAAYATNSRTIIVVNDWRTSGTIADRATYKEVFDPTNLEVHQYVAEWWWDQTAHDFIGQHLAAMEQIDCRWYAEAVATRDLYPDDWRERFLALHGVSPDMAAMLRIEADPTPRTRVQQERQWIDEMRAYNDRHPDHQVAGSRAAYYRLLDDLRASGHMASVRPWAPSRLPRAGARPRPITMADLEAVDRGESLPPASPSSAARSAFTAPITGAAQTQAWQGPGPLVDDLLAWEQPGPAPDDLIAVSTDDGVAGEAPEAHTDPPDNDDHGGAG